MYCTVRLPGLVGVLFAARQINVINIMTSYSETAALYEGTVPTVRGRVQRLHLQLALLVVS